MSEPGPSDAAPLDSRKPIVVRLGIAGALLIALVTGWQLLDGAPAPVDKPEPAPAPHAATGSVKDPNIVEPAPKPAESPVAPGGAGADREPAVETKAPPKMEAADPVQPSAPVAAKLAKGPYLQVGVFMHPTNANELKARLEAQGIPVHIAMRVQVGPFKDRAEAEAMREKLKAMGLASLLINQ